MFLHEYRAPSPRWWRGSAAQISTILSTGKYVAGCAWSGRRKGKFTFRLKSARSLTGKTDLHAVNYEATVTEAGRNREVSCAGGKDTATSADQDGTLILLRPYTSTSFNLKNNRFLRAYLAGYVNGMNENSDTPGVSGGTCTKTD
jgi:hypothetical protein